MTTVKDELLQRDVEAYFKANADIREGLTDLTPRGLSEALVAFALALKEAGVASDKERFVALLAEFGATLRSQKRDAAVLDSPRNIGVVVRAACRAGVLTDLEESAVGDMKPWQVTQAAGLINDAIVAAFEIPKA